jgi:hypothetical protein
VVVRTPNAPQTNSAMRRCRFQIRSIQEEAMFKGLILWLLGVPLGIVILLALVNVI